MKAYVLTAFGEAPQLRDVAAPGRCAREECRAHHGPGYPRETESPVSGSPRPQRCQPSLNALWDFRDHDQDSSHGRVLECRLAATSCGRDCRGTEDAVSGSCLDEKHYSALSARRRRHRTLQGSTSSPRRRRMLGPPTKPARRSATGFDQFGVAAEVEGLNDSRTICVRRAAALARTGRRIGSCRFAVRRLSCRSKRAFDYERNCSRIAHRACETPRHWPIPCGRPEAPDLRKRHQPSLPDLVEHPLIRSRNSIWYGWYPVRELPDMAFSVEGNVYVATYLIYDDLADDEKYRARVHEKTAAVAANGGIGVYLGDTDFTRPPLGVPPARPHRAQRRRPGRAERWYSEAFGYVRDLVLRIDVLELAIVMLIHPEGGDRLELLHRPGTSPGLHAQSPPEAVLTRGFGHIAFDVLGVDAHRHPGDAGRSSRYDTEAVARARRPYGVRGRPGGQTRGPAGPLERHSRRRSATVMQR